MKLTKWIVALLVACLCSPLMAAGKLGPGDTAPPLAVGKFVKGEPVKEFEKGKIYVIECWATWCGPCRQAIPHVTEMQKKFADKGVIFIGMNVWEHDASAVEPFVKQMGDKMDYRVATDDTTDGPDKGKMATTWLMAAGQNGIPCSFVVDKEGKIAWIGHPMNGLDKVVEGVIAGTFDPAKDAANKAKLNEINKKIQAAAGANDWDGVIAGLDEVIAVEPSLATRVGLNKFQVLLMKKKDSAAASALATKLAADNKTDAEVPNALAWLILKGEGIENRDNALALKLATQANEISKGENAAVLDTLAQAQLAAGSLDLAIETETKAVEKAEAGQMKAEMVKRLHDLKEQKENAGKAPEKK